MTDYTIKPMTRSELDIAVNWAAREGWNPGLNDADCYFKADPKGFFMGWLGTTPVSSISLVRYKNRFAFLGFYIVAPEFRGKGYGLKLWNHVMEKARGMNVGLDGVVDQQENYKKSGFKLAFGNIRFQGKARQFSPDTMNDIIPLAQVSKEDILAYDKAFFPEERSEFIQAWISQPPAIGVAQVLNNQIKGYGLIRECRDGYKIGPLFADTPDGADRIFRALVSTVAEGYSVFLDVPEPNTHAMELAKTHGMSPCFQTARMYTGEFPDLSMERTFGITSFEVG